jgi:hypothetical protein
MDDAIGGSIGERPGWYDDAHDTKLGVELR